MPAPKLRRLVGDGRSSHPPWLSYGVVGSEAAAVDYGFAAIAGAPLNCTCALTF